MKLTLLCIHLIARIAPPRSANVRQGPERILSPSLTLFCTFLRFFRSLSFSFSSRSSFRIAAIFASREFPREQGSFVLGGTSLVVVTELLEARSLVRDSSFERGLKETRREIDVE